MDRRKRINNGTLENGRMIFEESQSETTLPVTRSLRTVSGIPNTKSEALTSIFPLSAPAMSESSTFPQNSWLGNKISPSASRKPLIVRVVRKASLALIFLTTLPLHPKNILMMIYIFWFWLGGRRSDGNSILFMDSRKVSGVYVG